MSINPNNTSKHLCVLEDNQKQGLGLKNSETAMIGREIRFDPSILDTFDVMKCQPLHYDLLVLCAAIEFADRRWKRPLSWGRKICLTIPVNDIEAWQNPRVQSSLRSVLRHLSCDDWKFYFVHAVSNSPIGGRQRQLPLPSTKTIAIAYSDGLDSQAVSALSGEVDEALCIRVARHRQQRKKGESYFAQIPFTVKGHRRRESSFRSRGFQFAAVTAIAAHLSNIRRIIVPESGQGALGPALLPLHNIYADYRNHPTFYRKMERFIRVLLGYQLQYEQPRLWSTKGATMKAFLSLPGKTKTSLLATRSCWQSLQVVNSGGRKKQCGLCAACLLRRMSMYAADINEEADNYVVSNLATSDLDSALSDIPRKSLRDIMMKYGITGVRHFQQLADLAEATDNRLWIEASQVAHAIGESQEHALAKLKSLLAAHASEWQSFLSSQGESSFMYRWMDGGRYG